MAPIPFSASHVCRPRGLQQHIKSRMLRYALLGWGPAEIAVECRCHISTVYRLIENLMKYGSIRQPRFRDLGRPRILTLDDEEALLEDLLTEGWMQQKEMVFWLWMERSVFVHQSTVSRMLKRRRWTRKEIRRISLNYSEDLRREYTDDMQHYAAEEIVFLDESIFKEQTGWRVRGYAPIGVEGRYIGNCNRGNTWSICAAMTVEGYLPCTGVREGYFNTPDFLRWINTALLPTLRQQEQEGRARRVIVLDNLGVHIAQEIKDAIEGAGYTIKYLPPYSPDYNPIELSFSVLKAWVRRNYIWTRDRYTNFGDWLTWAVVASRCDRFAREQFRHSANGLYMEAAERERFFSFLRRSEVGEDTSEGIYEDIMNP